MLAQALGLKQGGEVAVPLPLPVPAQGELQAHGGARVQMRAPDGVIHRTQVQTAGVLHPPLHPPVLQQVQMAGVHRQLLVLPPLRRVPMLGVHHQPPALPLLPQAHGVLARRTPLDGVARVRLRTLDGEARALRQTAGMYSNREIVACCSYCLFVCILRFLGIVLHSTITSSI